MPSRGKSLRRRLMHAVGFECGLMLLVMDFVLLLFFLGYTFAYNWGFDAVFGLPQAASPATGH